MSNDNNRIIGRTEELEILQESLYSKESEFIAIYGRRRVGKTFLVNRAFKGGFTFQYTGLEHKSNVQQLGAFYKALLEQGMPKSSIPKRLDRCFLSASAFSARYGTKCTQ